MWQSASGSTLLVVFLIRTRRPRNVYPANRKMCGWEGWWWWWWQRRWEKDSFGSYLGRSLTACPQTLLTLHFFLNFLLCKSCTRSLSFARLFAGHTVNNYWRVKWKNGGFEKLYPRPPPKKKKDLKPSEHTPLNTPTPTLFFSLSRDSSRLPSASVSLSLGNGP